MPVKVRWEPYGVMFIPSGVVSSEEVYQAQKVVHTIPEEVTPQYQIVDARNMVKFDFDQMEIFNVSADDIAFSKKFSEFKIALISTSEAIEKTFINYLKISWSMNTKAELRMFKNIEAARKWINLPYPKQNDNNSTEGETNTDSLSLPLDR